jgi:hypothetical protein
MCRTERWLAYLVAAFTLRPPPFPSAFLPFTNVLASGLTAELTGPDLRQ